MKFINVVRGILKLQSKEKVSRAIKLRDEQKKKKWHGIT